MTIDWTIDVGTMLVMGGGILSFLWAAITVRDSLRDMRSAIGTNEPRTGILGALADHDSKIVDLSRATHRHREWLIEMNAKAEDPIRMERS